MSQSEAKFLQRWDRMTSALEADVSRLTESELLGEPQAAERVAAMRQFITSRAAIRAKIVKLKVGG